MIDRLDATSAVEAIGKPCEAITRHLDRSTGRRQDDERRSTKSMKTKNMRMDGVRG